MVAINLIYAFVGTLAGPIVGIGKVLYITTFFLAFFLNPADGVLQKKKQNKKACGVLGAIPTEPFWLYPFSASLAMPAKFLAGSDFYNYPVRSPHVP